LALSRAVLVELLSSLPGMKLDPETELVPFASPDCSASAVTVAGFVFVCALTEKEQVREIARETNNSDLFLIMKPPF